MIFTIGVTEGERDLRLKYKIMMNGTLDFHSGKFHFFMSSFRCFCFSGSLYFCANEV